MTPLKHGHISSVEVPGSKQCSSNHCIRSK